MQAGLGSAVKWCAAANTVRSVERAVDWAAKNKTRPVRVGSEATRTVNDVGAPALGGFGAVWRS